MNGATILCKPQSAFLADAGTALLLVKNARGMTLEDMGTAIGVSREMVAQYIAGEAEMGFVKWLRANAQWPELAERLEETEAERAARARQRSFDMPKGKSE